MTGSTRLPAVLGVLAAAAALAVLPAAAPAASGPSSSKEAHASVIGGTPATAGQWPSIAAIISSSQANARVGQYCGGTLVASRWVLTAAHCVVDQNGVTPAWQIDVAVGAVKLSEVSAAQRIRVSRVVPYPDYSPTAYGNDFALLKLSRDSDQPPMAIVPPGDDSLVTAGRAAAIAGWGCDLAPVGTPPDCPADGYPDQLQQAAITIQPDISCAVAYGSKYLASQMICAGLGYPNACFGDSGGPLTITGSSGKAVLVGDVSFGDQHCAGDADRLVYGRVSSYRSWIADVMAISVPSAPAVSYARGPAQGEVTVTWNAPSSDGGSAITGYRVTRYPDGSSVTLGAAARAQVFTGLDLATQYTFEVRAQNSAGESAAASTPATLPAINTSASFRRPYPARLASALNRGIREKVRCSRSCKVKLALKVSAGTAARYGLGSNTTVGSATARLGAGRTTTVTARFTSRARSRLRRARSIRLTVGSTATSTGYLPVTRDQTLKLRR